MESRKLTLNERIKFILKLRRIPQRVLAKEMQMSDSQVSNLLNGKKKFSALELIKVIEFLNIPYEDAIGKSTIFDSMLIQLAVSKGLLPLWEN